MNFLNYNQMIIRPKIFKCDIFIIYIYMCVCFHAVVYMMQHMSRACFEKKQLVFIVERGVVSSLESPD